MAGRNQHHDTNDGDRLRQAARQRAFRALKEKYPADYRAFYVEAATALGVPPRGTVSGARGGRGHRR